MRRALLIVMALSGLPACHKATQARTASTPEGAQSRGETASASDVEPPAPAPPEVTFEREYEEPPEPDTQASACAFQMGENFSYRGQLYFKARPFAKIDSFGKLQIGDLVAEEGRLYAHSAFSTEHARVHAEVYLPELSLHAIGPIVRSEWMQIHRTRIATRTSVKGAFFAPDVQLPAHVKLKTPLREDYRIPCSFVTVNTPETGVTKFDGNSASLSAPDRIVGLSLTPDGPAVAELVHPEGLHVGLLGMYKTTALVSVDAYSDTSDVTLVGWIHDGDLDDSGYGVGLGRVGNIGHPADRTPIDCNGISVFVEVDHKLHRLADVQDEMTFWGAPGKNGDFRVDLGGNDAWSAEKPPKDSAKEPLDPFIPKEYLARCEPHRAHAP